MGIQTYDSSAIFDNYVNSLGCTTEPTCYPDDCVNPPIVHICQYLIYNLTFETEDNITLYFSVTDTDVVGGKEPIEYTWTYSTAVFDQISDTNSSILILQVKPGKLLELLTGWVEVRATDADGCEAVKLCYIAQGVMKCNSNNFAVCYSPSNLVVTSNTVTCPKPTGLTVTNV